VRGWVDHSQYPPNPCRACSHHTRKCYIICIAPQPETHTSCQQPSRWPSGCPGVWASPVTCWVKPGWITRDGRFCVCTNQSAAAWGTRHPLQLELDAPTADVDDLLLRAERQLHWPRTKVAVTAAVTSTNHPSWHAGLFSHLQQVCLPRLTLQVAAGHAAQSQTR
jgi:hypothetical protein